MQGLPHSTVQEHDHTRKEAVQKLIHQFETHQNREALQTDLKAKSRVQSTQRAVEGNHLQHGKHGVLRDLRDHSQSVANRREAKSRVQSIQRAVEGNHLQHGKHGVFRDLRDHSQSTVSQLYDILDERHCILYLRNMFAFFRQNSKTKQGSLWCFVDSKPRDKERSISRCTSRKHREAKHLSRSPCLIQKGKKWLQTILNRFSNSLRYRESQTAIGWDEEECTATMQVRPKITLISLQHHSASDVKILRCLGSTVQVRTAR